MTVKRGGGAKSETSEKKKVITTQAPALRQHVRRFAFGLVWFLREVFWDFSFWVCVTVVVSAPLELQS